MEVELYYRWRDEVRKSLRKNQYGKSAIHSEINTTRSENGSPGMFSKMKTLGEWVRGLPLQGRRNALWIMRTCEETKN